MSTQNYDEKDEKELRKREEKTAEEKSFEEKYRNDPLSRIFWALILIWGGGVFLAENLGYLNEISRRFSDRRTPFFIDFEAWSLVFLGAGILLLIEVLIRYVTPEHRRPILGRLILGIVFVSIGINKAELIFPLILIAVGISVIFRGYFQKKQ